MYSSSDADWKLLSDFIESQFGLVFHNVRQTILQSRVLTRMKALEFEGVRDYYHYLLLSPYREKERIELAKTITNNETYFFREQYQFDLLVKHVIPSMQTILSKRPLRILSAACSSGEEPYTISIMLQDSGFEFRGVSWQIDGCDINLNRLESAQKGVYSEYSLRNCNDEQHRRYFSKKEYGFALKEQYKKNVSFFCANLVNPDPLKFSNYMYDIVFCRNVLIYFSETAFHKTISFFSNCLHKEGYLFLGHAESLINRRKDFRPVCLDSAIIYKKDGV